MDAFVPIRRTEGDAGKAKNLNQSRRHPERIVLYIPVVNALGDSLADECVAFFIGAQRGVACFKFAPKIGDSLSKIGDLVVEGHGHLLTPLRPHPSRMLL